MKLRPICVRLAMLAVMLWAGAQAAPAQQTLAEQARAEFDAGRFARAAELWRKVVSQQPNDLVALDGLIAAMDRLGRLSEVRAELVRLVEQWPNHAWRVYQLGLVTVWQGERDEGLALIDRAIELEPDTPEFRVGKAEVLSWNAATRSAAVTLLRTVLLSYPEHAGARRLLARLLAAEGKRDEALRLLDPLVAREDATAEDFVMLGQVEQAGGDLRAAEAAYRRALERNPQHLEALARLGELLSWRKETRAEAAQLFETGLKLYPAAPTLVVPYAKILFWERETSARAMQMLEELVARRPEQIEAKAALAQMLSYRDQTERARQLYDEVLARDPDHVPALRGKAELLNWRGEHEQALELLERARRHWPEDAGTKMELARAHLGLRHYAEAGAALGGVQEGGPYFEELQRDVRRSLGAYGELGYVLRNPRSGLDWHRWEAVVSAPLGVAHRLTLRYQPSLYSARERDFHANAFALALDSNLTERVSAHAEFGATQYPTVPTEYGGAFELRWRARPSLTLETGFRRHLVEDSFTAGHGQVIAGALRGPVQANLAHARATYFHLRHRFDLSFGYSDGAYTGRNLDANRRWGLDAGFGKVLHSYQPYVRVGYGLVVFNFDFNAGAQPGAGPPRVAAEYFSPHRFVLNYGAISTSYKWIPRVEWDAGATLGLQQVKDFSFSRYDNRMAYSLFTNLVWHVNDEHDLRVSYSYQDVFNAFRAHLFRFTWRFYF
jgi:tetratricopeptide (TPR) repeat protein